MVPQRLNLTGRPWACPKAESLATLLFFIVVSGCCAFSGPWPPPQTISALVTREVFGPNTTTPLSSEQTRVIVSSSNSWWRIQSFPLGRPTNSASFDCMRIPDGIRYFAVPQFRSLGGTNVYGLAQVLPLTSPPSEQVELHVAWLAFCPRPELPVTDHEQIRLFVPSHFSKLAAHPGNLGTYRADFIPPEKAFLAELLITNAGAFIDPAGKMVQADPPFDKGWLKEQFLVTRLTNTPAGDLAAKAVFTRFAMRPNARSASDTYGVVVCTIVLEKIEPLGSGGEVEPKLIAEDSRPPGLAEVGPIHYAVSNDHWTSVSDPKIQHLTRVAQTTTGRTHSKAWQRGLSLLLLAAMMLPAIAMAVLYLRKKPRAH